MQGKVDILMELHPEIEGKCKVINTFASMYDASIVYCLNAHESHNINYGNESFIVKNIPQGIFQYKKNIIGNGVVFDPVAFKEELDILINAQQRQNNKEECAYRNLMNLLYKIIICEDVYIVMPTHRLLMEYANRYYENIDPEIHIFKHRVLPMFMEGTEELTIKDMVSSDYFKTKYGKLKEWHIEQIRMYDKCISEKSGKNLAEEKALDIEKHIREDEQKFFKAIRFIKANIEIESQDVVIENYLSSGRNILLESRNSSINITANKIGEVYGIFNIYYTHTGTSDKENTNEANFINCFYRNNSIDLVALKKNCIDKGITKLIMMNVNELSAFSKIKLCVKYGTNGACDEYVTCPGWYEHYIISCHDYGMFPVQLKSFISYIEEYTGIPIAMVSVESAIGSVMILCNEKKDDERERDAANKQMEGTIEHIKNLDSTDIIMHENMADMHEAFNDIYQSYKNKKAKNNKKDNMDSRDMHEEYEAPYKYEGYGMPYTPYTKTSTKLPHFSKCVKTYDNEILTKDDQKYSKGLLLKQRLLGSNNLVHSRTEHEKFEANLHEVLDSLFEFLSAKNKNYGNSALEPIGIFSKGGVEDGILRRMDDKLNRIKNSDVLRKNDIVDLMGYLAILCINKKWTKFNELID